MISAGVCEGGVGPWSWGRIASRGPHPLTTATITFIHVLFLLMILDVTGAGVCTIPEGWRGHWYQSNVGQIVISASEVSKKGKCIDSRHDYYLVENIDIGCYTCLRIFPRHENVLQYQESFCVGKTTLRLICDQIQFETIQQTLIREPAIPVPCPFHDAFHYSYNNNSGGFCRDPPSYAKPCANTAQIRLHFKHCPYAAYTYHSDVDMACLATWHEGSEAYMLAELEASDRHGKEHKYRCFMYQILGTLIYVSMSADASCRGLRSSRDGPLLMELTRDVFGWPQPACRYPAWMSRYTWRDLSGRHVYKPNDDGDIITAHFRSDSRTSREEQHKAYRCFRVVDVDASSSEFSFVSFTSHGCTSRYQCMKFVKRKEGVVEIHEGRYMDYDTEPCADSTILDSNRKLLFPDTSEPKHCPFEGRYYIHTGSSICPSYFRSGCNGTGVLDILSSCSSKPGLQLECLKSWREDRKKFLVARLVGDETGVANCFSFRKKGKTLHFSADPNCNKGAPYILRDVVTYAMENENLGCDKTSKVTTKGVRSDNQSTRDKYDSHNPSQGGSYKHVVDSRESHDEPRSNSAVDTKLSHVQHTVLYIVIPVIALFTIHHCSHVNLYVR